MKEIYNTIKNLLTPIDGLYVDLDFGQLEEDNPPVNFPCALINIAITQAAEIGGKIQQCKCMITVRFGFKSTGETASIYPQAKIDLTLQYFDTIDAAFKALQGYSDERLEALDRKSMLQDSRPGLKITTMPFETAFEDWTAAL